MDSRLNGLLGFARRAGRLGFGSDAVLRDVQAGRAEIVLLSCDASPRTDRRIRQACEESRVSVFPLPCGKTELGSAVGRGDTAVIGVNDRSFAAGLRKICHTPTGGME